MAYEDMESGEKSKGGGKPQLSKMTLSQAIEMGEYNPDFLSTFPEWSNYTKHIQFQYIKRALDNRYKHLVTQWAEINNVLDFRLKPHLAEALKNIERQIKKLESDREILYYEYSK